MSKLYFSDTILDVEWKYCEETLRSLTQSRRLKDLSNRRNISGRSRLKVQTSMSESSAQFSSAQSVSFWRICSLFTSSTVKTSNQFLGLDLETCWAERPAQRFVFRYTLHRACSEWKQWLKMKLIHSTSMHYSHTTRCVCVCFMCVLWGWYSDH